MSKNYYTNNPQSIMSCAVRNNLKKEIKGSVKTTVVEDTLIVDIYAVNGIVYRYTLRNLCEQIVQGLNSQMVAKNIVKQYRAYIKNLFFL